MSATILENTRTTPVSVLVDYELHHSGQEEHTPTTSSLSSAPTTQPPNWPSDHRRIPAYRPINRNLDFSQRPPGSNNVERVIITVMLHGVWLNAVRFSPYYRIMRNGQLVLGDIPSLALYGREIEQPFVPL